MEERLVGEGEREEETYVVLDISSTTGRRNDLLDSGSVGGENLLLESTDREDLTSECHLSSHCYGRRHNQHNPTIDPLHDVPRSELIPCFVNNDTNAVRIAIPADGPSFPTEPSLNKNDLSTTIERKAKREKVRTACEDGYSSCKVAPGRPSRPVQG